MEPAARGGPDGPLVAVRPGWWVRNQGFIRRRAETLSRRPAAEAEAEAERGREPASKKSMADLLVPAAAEVRGLDCAVCLEDLVAGGRKLRRMGCSHSFHQRCIFRWLHVSRLCPMCRFPMPSRPDDECVGDEVERELAAEEKDDGDEEKFAATEEGSSATEERSSATEEGWSATEERSSATEEGSSATEERASTTEEGSSSE